MKRNIQQIVSENIKERMRELRLTQKTLAERLGTAQPNVHRWISGEVMPDKNTQEKLCKVLECKIERLIRVEDKTRITEILNSIDKRLGDIEEKIIPKKEVSKNSILKDLASSIKQKAEHLGLTPYDVLLQEIAEGDKIDHSSLDQTNLDHKKTP